MWIEIRQFDIFGKKTLRQIHGIKESLNLDQDSGTNHQMNTRQISKIKIHKKLKLKLKLTQITIQK